MKSILEELFYGNLCPNADCRSKGKEVKELMGYIADHHDTLIAQLNEKQRYSRSLMIVETSLRILTKERFLCMLLSLV